MYTPRISVNLDGTETINFYNLDEIIVTCIHHAHLKGFTPFYILHTHVFGTYLLGGYLPCRKDYKVWYFQNKGVMVFYM